MPLPPDELDIPFDLPNVEEQDDGSALITDMTDETDDSTSAAFGENLAATIKISDLNTIAGELIELIEKDKEARKKRDKQQEEGIRRTGLGDDAPGGATFEGAAKVVHPALAEGCVDFSARAIKELFPANGPVKTKIYGKQDNAKLDKARGKRDFLNWYTTVKMPEYRSEKEILLTQLPLGGSQYEKYWYDPSKKRVCMEFVPIDKVFLPYAASSFYDSPRITHEQERTEAKIQEYVDSEFYLDIFDLSEKTLDETGSQKATNKVEGKSDSGYNEDGVRIIYEVTCVWDVEGDGPKPYVIHIDESTEEICAIYRNWKEVDDTEEALQWWVEDKFIPWRGVYGIGLPHLIGGLAGALTGALRALLDSAHINNAPSAIKLKGGRASGQNVNVELTAVTEIEAPAGIDDIRKVMMPLPFNPPSAVLFQLLDWITTQAKGVVATAEEKISDASNNMPVGTTLALIEQGSQVFSSIHSRLHESQRRALKIICRLIADYPDGLEKDFAKFNVQAEDFLETDDIEPVSDPNIFSETQRAAQTQAVMQMAAADAQDTSIPWDKLAIRRRALEMLRIDGIDEILPKPPEPISADPVTENGLAAQGKPIGVGFHQDHMAHIQAHLNYIISPINQLDPSPDPSLAVILGHCRVHLLYLYQQSAGQGVQYVMQNGPQPALAPPPPPQQQAPQQQGVQNGPA